MEKGVSRRGKRLDVLLGILSVLLAGGFCFWMLIDGSSGLSHILDVDRGVGSKQELNRVPSSKFKLKQLYRHGVGNKCEWLQKLDVDAEFLERAGLLYRRQMKINERTSDEPLWTADRRFLTDNPFSYEFEIRSDLLQMKRMSDRSPDFLEGYLDFAMDSPSLAAKVAIDWIDDEVVVPNVTDKDTIISLALMSSNAYVKIPHTGDWRNISSPWNKSQSDGFGWDDDGLRGHVFVNEEANIVILSFKGTSAQGLPGYGVDETTANDKINDNLLFSCCCARVSYLWTTVCDCYTKSYTCDEACLEKELRKKDYYYAATMNMYKQVYKEYPNATIWTTGHSLGGALAALLGRTYGLPAVAFEAPGELLAAKRLHLPFPPGLPSYLEGIWHIGHTADPIYMGTCNGASSTCSIAGYAMETSCHSGRVCVYDVVNDKGWHVNMLNHRIHTVIDGILNEYEEVAQCIEPEPCVDCYNWQYVPGRGARPGTTMVSKTTSSKTASQTAKPTSSCLERNWFGVCTRYG
ncbi:hypothetical protein HG536_0A09080 [Torulaspora globosa]|uniref:Putative lipase ATG15 n=1 Tax=Torulaspora globosa TaxID=48254 RepID=A0A7G3ZC55_9SACH|nr:uncharacterized protein HG536_0A09080 [Torulaspora globosa]QLL31091.1 hypothetical protein HG536_0A09080 [Torulaspora globosa]